MVFSCLWVRLSVVVNNLFYILFSYIIFIYIFTFLQYFAKKNKPKKKGDSFQLLWLHNFKYYTEIVTAYFQWSALNNALLLVYIEKLRSKAHFISKSVFLVMMELHILSSCAFEKYWLNSQFIRYQLKSRHVIVVNCF